MEKTKVLFAAHNLGKGGAERVLATLLENLDADRIEPVCVLFTGEIAYKIPGNIKIYVLNSSPARNPFAKLTKAVYRIVRLAGIINKERPEVLCGFLTGVNFVLLAAGKISKVSCRIIFSEHSTPSIELYRKTDFIYRFMLRAFYNAADLTIAVSKGVKDDLAGYFGVIEGKIKVIYNPIDIEMIQIQKKEAITGTDWFNGKVPVVITAGSLTKPKAQDRLIRAFKLVRSRLACKLVLLGEGPRLDELKNICEDLDIEEDVAFLGFQQNPYKYVARSTVFVLSSDWEGFGNVLVEAVACGTPVISSDCKSGPDEIIENNVTGILVPVKDENSLAAAILELITNKEKAREYAQKAKDSTDRFSVKKILDEYCKVFAGLN